MNPFATTTTASTNMPSVVLAALAMHATATPPVAPDFTIPSPVYRLKTILGGEKEHWGG